MTHLGPLCYYGGIRDGVDLAQWITKKYGPIWMAICTREKPPSFLGLHSILLVEENHMGVSTIMHADNKTLYMEADQPCGCGG